MESKKKEEVGTFKEYFQVAGMILIIGILGWLAIQFLFIPLAGFVVQPWTQDNDGVSSLLRNCVSDDFYFAVNKNGLAIASSTDSTYQDFKECILNH